MENTSTITKEQLIENGWTILGPESPLFLAEKRLGTKEDGTIDDTPDADRERWIDLVLHNFYNTPIFAISITDGYMLNLNPSCIEDLQFIEKMILSVDTPY